ncbi:fasciclin-like arabinogalactan protein 4, partial [Amborella trichopoda]|uniref:fasciclin-like arabinogalactan protein 4 n=1 Tax=Amborella trichopoda TaxID=13333 RepID=UPI0009C0B63B
LSSTLLLLLLLLLHLSASSSSLSLHNVNITHLLSSHPSLSTFSNLLSTTGLASDLSHRSSLTLLAIPNPVLDPLLPHFTPSQFSDILRFHVLLRYLDPSLLRQIPPSGVLVTTLFQTTGRAEDDRGALNLTRRPDGLISAAPSRSRYLNTTTLANFVTSVPYVISVFSVSTLLVLESPELTTSETHPPPEALINITKVLADSGGFEVVAAMIAASGVAAEFESDEQGAGITVFAPTDEAFSALPPPEKLQDLSADKKAVVLKYHVLHCYYPLGSLESIVNPVQPTLATEQKGAGQFTLNITRANNTVAIDTGLVQASITRTVFDQNPVAVFGISHVLLPREVFSGVYSSTGGSPEYAPPPELPLEAPETEAQPTRFSAAPGRDVGASIGRRIGVWRGFVIIGWVFAFL